MEGTPDEVFYFGCIGQPGHYLWSPTGGKRWFDELPEGFPDAWTFRESHSGRAYVSESSIAPRPMGPQGAATMTRVGDWTALSFPDRSVDSRPNCVSVFMVAAPLTFAELLEEARRQWPQIFRRYDFEISLRALA